MKIKKIQLTGNNHGGKISKQNRLYANYAFFLTVAACLAGSIGSTTLMLGITLLYAPLFFKPEHLLCPLLFFTIFDDFMLVASNASASRFITIFFVLGAALSILRKGTIRQTSLYFALLIALSIILSFYSAYGRTSFPISSLLNMLLAIAMLNLSITSAENVSKQFYKFAALVVIYVYLLLFRNGFDSLVEGTRMSIAENVNSNALAMGLAIIMAILVADLLLYKNHLFSSIVLIAANCVALFLTGSRSALIAAIVAPFLLYIINAQDKHSKRNAFYLLVVSSILLIVIYRAMEHFFPTIMERFTAENIGDSGGSGRLDVWKNYFTYFFPKYWLFGMGGDSTNLHFGLASLNLDAHGAHNIIIEILTTSGIIGLVLYAVCFVKFFNATTSQLRINKAQLLPIAIVLTILINGIGENTLGSRFTWFGVGLGYMLLYSANKEAEKTPRRRF